MMATIRSELRKLLTVRSTYFIVLISLAIVALFAGFGDGFRADAAHLHDPGLLVNESYSAIVFVGIILGLAGLLLVGHEYRYNTIMYTLAASRRRYRVLLGKLLIVTLFAVITSVLVALFSPLCTIIGAHLAGKHIAPQTYHVWPVLAHAVFCGWGYAMYAFIIVSIIRNQVGSIVAFLIIPLIGENILTAIFHWIGKYLPFSSIQSVVVTPGSHDISPASLTHSVVTALIYIAGGLLVSFVLFARRDAN